MIISLQTISTLTSVLIVIISGMTVFGLFSNTKANGSTIRLGKYSTAKQVIEHFGKGNYLEGKVAIVTGGNAGIGLETCKALLSAGAKVYLCSRSIINGKKAIEEEVLKSGLGGYVVENLNDRCVIKQLDLEDLSSVKKFATDILATEKRIDFLILNAGIMKLPTREETNCGFEKQIAVNHYGHAYLTNLLKEKMKSQDLKSRIIILSSVGHTYCNNIDFNDIHYSKGRKYGDWGAYFQSKLCNLLYAKGLADDLVNSNVSVVSLHPGNIKTNLWKYSSIASLFFTDKSIPQGASTTIFAAVSPRIEDADLQGAYLVDCAPYPPSAYGQDIDKSLRNQLMKVTNDDLDNAIKKLNL